MKRKNFVINGVEFENMGATETLAVRGREYCHSDIYMVYSRPSCYKEDIWKEWCNWAEYIDDSDYDNYAWIEISSHNSQTFSISGQVREHGQSYVILITKAHNRAWCIK